MPYDTLPSSATLKPTKFDISTPQQDIDDFKQLLKLSKLGTKTYENSDPKDEFFGLSYEWLSNAKKVWETEYDWRKTEAHIASFPNFKVDIKDKNHTVPVHFIALYSEKKDAVPLMFLHGWPGSFLEFIPILELLKSKYAPQELPYHVIIPSVPGYGYSADSIPTGENWTMHDSARVLNTLMTGLGFGDGYISQGGDIGSYLTRILAAKYDACKGAHLNFCIMNKPEGVSESDISAHEQKGIARLKDFQTVGSAYAREHATRPATIGHVLSSSPLALLAWIGEKFLVWTHHDPPLSQILDSVTLYWFTSSFPRSIYPYRQTDKIHDNKDHRISSPKAFGYSFFPYDLAPVPVAWVATTGDLSWSRVHETGGHFASMERPEALMGDVDDFVKKCWKGPGAKL